jgi:intein-encoded DNA endonuclease-like protein
MQKCNKCNDKFKYKVILKSIWKSYSPMVSGDATMYSLNGNEQVDDFSTFVKYVIEYVESTTEYKSLPEPKGGYD